MLLLLVGTVVAARLDLGTRVNRSDGAARLLLLSQIRTLLLALLHGARLTSAGASPFYQSPELCCASSAAATTPQAPAASQCRTPACATARGTTTNASTIAASAWWVGVHPSALAHLLTCRMPAPALVGLPACTHSCVFPNVC